MVTKLSLRTFGWNHKKNDNWNWNILDSCIIKFYTCICHSEITSDSNFSESSNSSEDKKCMNRNKQTVASWFWELWTWTGKKYRDWRHGWWWTEVNFATFWYEHMLCTVKSYQFGRFLDCLVRIYFQTLTFARLSMW